MLSLKKTMGISFVLTLAVWLFVAWPVPRYFAVGIPSSAANVEKDHVRRMFHGDHLQLLYNYWLIADMFAGKTPWFHNVYEFNTGDDAARRYVGIDDAPFVFLFSALNPLLGRAAAWNASQFIALWLTHLFSWLLLRRYLRSSLASAALALLGIALPFRWTSLLGGSPSGFAMTWVPLWMWGLDAAIRRGRVSAGVLAGLAVVFASWNDAHVFFFSVLAIPCWVVGILLMDPEFPWRNKKRWIQASVACLPFVVLVGGVVLIGQLKHSGLAETTFEAGKEWREVALYSPRPFGLWKWQGFGHEAQIYIGILLPLFLVAGFVAQIRLFLKHPADSWRSTLACALLLGACATVIMLALGTHGPWDALFLRAARKLIPPYAMIRQPAKIYCLMPTLLMFAGALSWRAWTQELGWLSMPSRLLIALVAAMVLELGFQIRPTVCVLDHEQGAYAAVAEHARSHGVEPRAIVLPIWPGDSSWASLYEHYVSLYRIRMINGYQPAVPKEYIENVFSVFESFNCGLLDETQRVALKRFKIDYVLLHEDAFPEKVSWFPVAFTIKKLLNHPYLELLRQDRNVWAFRILDEPRPRTIEIANDWQIFFPNYHHEMEWSAKGHEVANDSTASGGRFLRAVAQSQPIPLRPFEHLQAPYPILLLRLRGEGRLGGHVRYDEAAETELTQEIRAPDWQWTSFGLPDFGSSLRAGVTLTVLAGTLDLDLLIYTSGQLPVLNVGETFSLPAALFFHAGYTDLADGSVVLRKDYEPADVIVYGPKLPFPPAEYRVEMQYSSGALAGTVMGHFFIETETGRTPDFPVVAGSKSIGEYSSLADNLPATLRFRYARNADMRIHRFVFTRIR